MEETIFPPSVNWYLSKNLSCRRDGTVAYGAKNNVVVLHADGKKRLSPSVIDNAHESRITAVCFPPDNCSETIQNTVASCGEDGHVKLWDIDTLHLLSDQKLHWDGKEPKGKVTSMDWSRADPKTVVSSGENDTLVSWNVSTNTGTRFHFLKLQPVVVSSRPDDEKIVAVGSRSGLVHVVKLVDKGKILFKLRGHDSEVQSVSWCPVDGNVFRSEVGSKERLLATCCKDPEVLVWRAGSETGLEGSEPSGGLEAALRLPSNPLSHQEKHRYKGNAATNFVPCFWAEPGRIFSATVYGELVVCRIENHVPSTEKGKSKTKDAWELAHDFHSRGVYAVSGIQSIGRTPAEETDGESAATETSSPWIWTAGTDQKLIASKSVGGRYQSVRNFNTLNGFPYSVAASPHDPNRIAVAAGDGVVRLWNLSESTGDVHIFWQKVKDKVMTVEWHPTKDGLLAYGTSEGRVGTIETHSHKMPTLFKIVYPQSVYRLSWGPFFGREGNPEGDGKDLALYSVCNGSLLRYNLAKPAQAPLNLSKILDFSSRKQTDVCWKPDFSLMAVGNDDGTICLLSPPRFDSIVLVPAYKKTIQSIAWHPVFTVFDRDVSSYGGYFATGTTDKDNDIYIFNCRTENEKVTVEKVALLKGHKHYLQHVSWSPHVAGRLVSSSADCSVRIWDVISGSVLCVFVPFKTRMPLFSVWSPIDPDLIVTGCRDKILTVWRISTAEESELPDLEKIKKKKIKKPNASKAISSDSVNVKEKYKEADEENNSFASAKSEETVKTTKEPKIFSGAWKGNLDDPKNCYCLLKKQDDSGFNLGFLGNQNRWTEAIDKEVADKKRSNSWSELYQLSLWRGDLKRTVEEGIESGRLTDFLVSLAPVVSPRLWQEACIAYSKELAGKKQYRKAATYLVACHKIKEAVSLLVDNDLFLEALCIVRSRYDGEDDEIRNVIRKYAEWLRKTGSFTRAAECFIYLKDYVEAAKVMGKRNEAEYLSVAALAAKSGGSDFLERSYALAGLLKCLDNQNLDLALDICKNHPDLKHLKILYHAYDCTLKLIRGELKSEKNILEHVKDISEIGTDRESYEALKCPYDKNVFYKTEQEIAMAIARELSLACSAADSDTTSTHVIQALSAAFRYVPKDETANCHLLYETCRSLAPSGFLVPNGLFDQNREPASKTKSLRAFLCEASIQELEKKVDDPFEKETWDLIRSLKNDLFDPENVKFFKNHVRVKALERKLTEDKKSDVAESEIKSDLETLNRLKEEVENFESRRIICPNPVISYCKIRNVVQRFPNGENFIREIEESPFGKSLICED